MAAGFDDMTTVEMKRYLSRGGADLKGVKGQLQRLKASVEQEDIKLQTAQEEAVASRKALDQAQAERDEGLLTLVRLRVEWADAHRSAEDKEAQAAAIREEAIAQDLQRLQTMHAYKAKLALRRGNIERQRAEVAAREAFLLKTEADAHIRIPALQQETAQLRQL